jgi:hypothetical protein
MKVMQPIRQALAWGLSALALSTVLLCSVACTRGGDKNPDGTQGGTAAVTTPANGNNNTGSNTTRPLDPDAGTVDPNGDAGDPPTGTEGGTQSRGILPRMMH